MATISSYSTAAGKRYRVRYRTPDHRQTDKRGFRTKRDAEAFAATVEVEKLLGSYVAPALGRITVAEIAPSWLERKNVDLKPSTYNSLETAWRVHVAPRWGSTRIADIDGLKAKGIGGRRGVRTLPALLVRGSKWPLPAESHHCHSRPITRTRGQVWAKCGHAGVGPRGCGAGWPRREFGVMGAFTMLRTSVVLTPCD